MQEFIVEQKTVKTSNLELIFIFFKERTLFGNDELHTSTLKAILKCAIGPRVPNLESEKSTDKNYITDDLLYTVFY